MTIILLPVTDWSIPCAKLLRADHVAGRLTVLLDFLTVPLCSSEDQLNSIAERTMQEADKDNDQMISFQEFCAALERTDVEQKMSIKFLK